MKGERKIVCQLLVPVRVFVCVSVCTHIESTVLGGGSRDVDKGNDDRVPGDIVSGPEARVFGHRLTIQQPGHLGQWMT